MVSIYDVEPRKLIEAVAAELEKMPEMAPPEWAIYVKTGMHRMRPPAEENWWYIRSAAVLRAIYRLGPIGVQKLRTKYGGRKNRGVAPDKTFKASGNILRKILQKFEIIGFVKQAETGVHKGRILTPKGISFMDKLAVQLKDKYTGQKKTVEKKPKAEKPVDKPKEEKTKEEKPAKQPKEEKPKTEEPKVEDKPKKEKKPVEEKVEKKAPEPKQEKPKPEEKPAEKPKEKKADVKQPVKESKKKETKKAEKKEAKK